MSPRKNGGSWVQLTIPTLPITYYQMSAVGALASNDVWMAGSERTLNPSTPTLPYVIHWNGSAWTRRPTTGFVQEFLTLASNDVWAFGTTIEHWNGSAWTLVADYRATLDSAQTVGAVAVNGCDLWGVGTQWASANGPPVAGLAVHVGAASAGAAVLRGPCNTTAHAHGIVPLTTPRVGQAMRVSVGDPFAVTGITGAWLTAWAWAFGAGPQAPCGVVLPGLGLGGGAIEALVDGSAVFVSSMSWSGSPLGNEHSVLLPPAPGLAGLQIHSQAVLLGSNGLVATNALDLTIGF